MTNDSTRRQRNRADMKLSVNDASTKSGSKKVVPYDIFPIQNGESITYPSSPTRNVHFALAHSTNSSSEEEDENEQNSPQMISQPIDFKYQSLQRKIERLEQRLETYEVFQQKYAKKQSANVIDIQSEAITDSQQLMDIFLTEMEKQRGAIAEVADTCTTLEHKVESTVRQSRKFHHYQQQHHSQLEQVMQRIENEFIRGTQLQEEEKELSFRTQHHKLMKVQQFMMKQLEKMKESSTQHYRQLDQKYKEGMDVLSRENKYLQIENKSLRQEIENLNSLSQSNKRTLKILTDEVLKIKRNDCIAADSTKSVEQKQCDAPAS